jgi:hypothetical protein
VTRASKVVVLPALIRFEGRARVGTLTFTFDELEAVSELLDTHSERRILIHDSFFASELVRLGLALKSNRGSYYQGPKLKEWFAQYGNALAEALRTSQAGDALLKRTP